MPRIGKTPTERDLNDVFEIELDFIGRKRVGKSIERPLQLGFQIFENRYNCLNSRLVDHTARSIDEQADIFVELDIRRKYHWIGSPFFYVSMAYGSAHLSCAGTPFRYADHRLVQRHIDGMHAFGLQNINGAGHRCWAGREEYRELSVC